MGRCSVDQDIVGLVFGAFIEHGATGTPREHLPHRAPQVYTCLWGRKGEAYIAQYGIQSVANSVLGLLRLCNVKEVLLAR